MLFASTIAISHVPAQFGIALAFLGWILEGIVNKNWQVRWSPFFFPLILYICWNIISSALSPRPMHSLWAVADNEWALVLMLVMFWTVRSTPTLKRIIVAMFISSSIAMVYAIWQTFFGVELYRHMPLDKMGGFFRSTGFFGFYLTFAAFAMSIFFFSASFVLERRSKERWRWAYLPIISFFAVIFTFARSIWLSFGAVIPILGFLRGKKKDWIYIALLFCCFIVAVIWVPTLRERAESIFDLQGNETRINLWKTSLAISQDFRFVGIGEDNFDYYFEKYRVEGYYNTIVHPHNDYLNVLVNSGYPGLIFFLALWGIALRTGVLTWRRSKDDLVKAVALGGIMSLGGLMIGALFQDYYGTFVNCLEWWFVTGLVFAAHRVQQETEDAIDSTMTRAEREQKAYDEGGIWKRSHDSHMRFRHVFECPNTIRYELLFDETIRSSIVNKQVLEIGCGDGIVAERLYRFGASYLLGIDISKTFIEIAKKRELQGKLEFLCGNVEEPLKKQFDLIIGRSILHHLNYRAALRRLYDDNLRTGGSMVFMEPLGGNPLIKIHHLITSAHTPDEISFGIPDLNWLKSNFTHLLIYPINLFSFPLALLSSLVFRKADNALLRTADRLDVWVANHLKLMIPMYRHCLLLVKKPVNG